MSWRDALVAVLAIVAAASTLATASLAMVVHYQGLQIAAMDERIEALEDSYTYHDLQLSAHSDALVDWYKWRESRSHHWGSGNYWAALVALREGGGP